MAPTRHILGFVFLALALLAPAGAAISQAPVAPSVDQATTPSGTAAQQPAPQAPPVEPAPPVLTPQELREVEEMQRTVATLKGVVDRLEAAVGRNLQNDEELTRLLGQLMGVFDDAKTARAALAPKSEALRQQIEQLGAAPVKDAPPEAVNVAEERARLNAKAAEIDGAQKNIELTVVRANQLRDSVQSARQKLFASHVLKRSPSPVAPATWQQLFQDIPGIARQTREMLSGWFTLAGRKAVELAALAGGTVILIIVLVALVRRFLARRLDAAREQPPSFFIQAATIGWMAPLLAMPGLVALAVFGVGLDGLGLLTLEVGRIAETAFPALAIFIAVSALSRAILQPRRPSWRLVDLSTRAARRLTGIVTGIAAVFSADLIMQEVIARLYLPLSLSIIETALASIAIGVLMVQLVRTRFEPKPGVPRAQSLPDGADPVAAPAVPASAAIAGPSVFQPILLKLPILAAAVAILVVSSLGYVGLGRFITQQVIVTGSAIAVVLVFHLAIRALLGAPGTGIKPFEAVLHDWAGLDEAQSAVLTRSLSALLNIALALAAVPLVLMAWGYTPDEALSWVRTAVFGFQIGDFRISLARIMLAALLFVLLVSATRLVQSWLDTGVLKSQRFDQGIANSVRTAVGYAGFIFAALVAVSYGGLDVTNFAIVAGALSVGIGLGLQSIVNNFVSGLILLVERPIKVGDRISVNGLDGFVRRISVRSTEIETPEKASLIVPNSALVTSPVTNWTHRNALGSASVRVTVSAKSDPERVREVLMRVGVECPLLLQHPPPSVNLESLGANGFEFSLGSVIPDVTKSASVQSELRFRIVKALREAGIEMPNAQHDVHLRDLDAVRTILMRLAEERMQHGGAPEKKN